MIYDPIKSKLKSVKTIRKRWGGGRGEAGGGGKGGGGGPKLGGREGRSGSDG